MRRLLGKEDGEAEDVVLGLRSLRAEEDKRAVCEGLRVVDKAAARSRLGG